MNGQRHQSIPFVVGGGTHSQHSQTSVIWLCQYCITPQTGQAERIGPRCATSRASGCGYCPCVVVIATVGDDPRGEKSAWKVGTSCLGGVAGVADVAAPASDASSLP